MNKSRPPSEFAFQVLALLAAVIVVHAFYVGLIRPSADAQLAAQAAYRDLLSLSLSPPLSPRR